MASSSPQQQRRTEDETGTKAMQSPDSAIHSAPTSQASPEERAEPSNAPPAGIPISPLLTNSIRDLPIRHSSMTPHILGPEYTKFLVGEDPLMIVLPRRTASRLTRAATGVVCEQDSSYLVKEVETIKAPTKGAAGHTSSHLAYSSLARESSLTKSEETLLRERSLDQESVEKDGSLALRGLNLELLRRYIYDVPTRSYKIRYAREVKLASESVSVGVQRHDTPNTYSAAAATTQGRAQPQRIRIRQPPATIKDEKPALRRGTFERHSASRQPLRPGQGGAAKQLLTVRSRSQEAPRRVEITILDRARNLHFSTSTDVLRRLLQPIEAPESSVVGRSTKRSRPTRPTDYRVVAEHMRPLENDESSPLPLWPQPNLITRDYEAFAANPPDDWKSPLITHQKPSGRPRPQKGRVGKPNSSPLALDGFKSYCLYVVVPLLIVLAAAAAIVVIIHYI